MERDEAGALESHVTVIIPCFNAEKYIGEAIESVFSQTYKNWDLIVIDDGSTDSSLQVVAELAALRPGQVQVLSGPNRGACHARNWGIQVASGEFIALLDADDFWSSQKIEKQIQFLVNKPSVIGVTTGYLLWDRRKSKNTAVRDFHWTRKELSNWAMLGPRAPALNSTLLAKREALQAVGGFDEVFFSFAEDLDLGWRLASFGALESIGGVLTTIRLSPDQNHHNSDEMLSGMATFFKKIAPLEPTLAVKGVMNLGVYRTLVRIGRGQPTAIAHLLPKLIFRNPLAFARFLSARVFWPKGLMQVKGTP